jgi:chromosome segregation ATPase
MSTQDTSHSDNMQPIAPMFPVSTSRNTSKKRQHSNMEAPDEPPRSDNNENGSDPEQIETSHWMEVAKPFIGLMTKTATKADLASIDGALARLREDVEQRVTLEESNKIVKKIDRLSDEAEADRSTVSHMQKAVDTKADSADLDCVGETLKQHQTELRSVQDSQKQFATLEAVKYVHQEQASRDANLQKRLDTLVHSVSTMQDGQKQFATSEELQTSIDIQDKVRKDSLEKLKEFIHDKIEAASQSMQGALKDVKDPLVTRLKTLEDGLKSTKKSLTGQIATVKNNLVERITAVESNLKTKTQEIHGRMGTVETILETSTAEYTELRQKIDGLVNRMDDERKERANLEEELRVLRKDLNAAETTRQKDKKEFEELVGTLRQEREEEKQAHTRTAAQLVNKDNELKKLKARIAAVKIIQDGLTSKIARDIDNKINVYTVDSNEYITARLLEHTEDTKDYFIKRMTAKDENVRKDLSRYCKDLQEESDRAAEERLEVVRKDFETRLTENSKALSAYGKDVTRYVDVVDPLSADIYALKEELTTHHKSLKDEIQEHLVQAKVYTDQSMRTVDLSNTDRDRFIWESIDLVKTVQVSVLEAKMDESKAQQDRLMAKQNETREELDAQKKQHHTFRNLVEKGRKDIDDRYGKLATMVHNQDSFLDSFKEYSSV